VASYKDEHLVFAHAEGPPVNPWSFSRAVLDCIMRAKVRPVTLHGLRDTHASLLAKAGVPLEVMSKDLGHSNIGATVERYRKERGPGLGVLALPYHLLHGFDSRLIQQPFFMPNANAPVSKSDPPLSSSKMPSPMWPLLA